ncbi:MAG: PaaI family thioesterase, partial [Candidatus Kapaibacterium sp.]
APTVQLNVRYRHPVPIGEAIHVRATLERVDGRKNMLRAFITRVNEESRVLAECEALFLTVPGTMQSRDESSMEKS